MTRVTSPDFPPYTPCGWSCGQPGPPCSTRIPNRPQDPWNDAFGGASLVRRCSLRSSFPAAPAASFAVLEEVVESTVTDVPQELVEVWNRTLAGLGDVSPKHV